MLDLPSLKNDANASKVLVIVTGGTICMTPSGLSSSLRPQSIADQLRSITGENDIPSFDTSEWDELIDSSDISLDTWVALAKEIEKNYDAYIGFVILHGTDTLAYTASALSFMLENLAKPVVVTGAMLPFYHIQTDARRNFSVALMVAAYSGIAEVCVLFGSFLLRGNRCSKMDCNAMSAFNSPNFPPLGRVGIDITVDEQLFLQPTGRPFRAYTALCLNVVVVTITPGFYSLLLRHLLASPVRPLAVILRLYGSGTAPIKNNDLFATIKSAKKAGIEVVVISQCSKGTCSLLTYENGALLYHIGVIEGKDLTCEAAIAKLAYLMGKGYTGERLRQLMEKNIRGEVTEQPVKVTGQASLASQPCDLLSPTEHTKALPEQLGHQPPLTSVVPNNLLNGGSDSTAVESAALTDDSSLMVPGEFASLDVALKRDKAKASHYYAETAAHIQPQKALIPSGSHLVPDENAVKF